MDAQLRATSTEEDCGLIESPETIAATCEKSNPAVRKNDGVVDSRLSRLAARGGGDGRRTKELIG